MTHNDDRIATTAELARLFDVTAKTIADLAKREIIVPGLKRRHWQLQPSVTGYIKHLRAEAAGRGGEAGRQEKIFLIPVKATTSLR